MQISISESCREFFILTVTPMVVSTGLAECGFWNA